MSIFVSTLNQTTFLFAFIAIGFLLSKTKQIPENTATVLSKLENTVFIPALVLGTFIENFTMDRIYAMWKLILSSCIIMLIAAPIAIFISKCLSKDKYIRNINLKKAFTDIGIYAVTIIRLIALPLAFLGIAHFIPMDRTIFICALCSLAMPLGLNTIVIPSAYGKDTSVPAGMAVVSHLLSCLTIPLLFMFIA